MSGAKRAWSLPSARHGATLFLLSMLSAICIRHFIFEASDPYRCGALLSSGGHWYNGLSWLVPGCTTEGYDKDKINSCVSGREIVVIGDGQMQSTYWALVQKLGGDVPPWGTVDQDLDYDNGKVKVKYYWDPYLNGSRLYKKAEAYAKGGKSAPAILIVGGGRWYADHHDYNAFSDAVDHLTSSARPASGYASIGSHFSPKDGPGDIFLYAPFESDSASETTAEMNAHLEWRAGDGAIDVAWSFSHLVSEREEDDYHIPLGATVDEVTKRRADVLLNLRCNAKVTGNRGWSSIRPCCATWTDQPNWEQSLFVIMGLAVFPAVVLLDWRMQMLSEKARPVVRAFAAFTAAVSLQWVADRTHVFEQVARLPLEVPNLRNMIIFILILGAVSIRRSKSPKRLNSGETQPDQPFLPRDQTDEWKGWMQALIIVYHYNMAWTALWFWEIIRLAVSSYLFMTGFGHAVFFMQKKDYSFKRVAAVMIRTNLLPITLAYVMKTRWLLYYYMPLSSFWFLVVYATMAAGSRYNEYTWFLLAKIVASAYLVRAFIDTPDLPDTLVKLFKIIFRVSFDAKEFFDHRVRIDHYIVYVGMLSAIFYVWSKDVLTSDRRQDRLSKIFRIFFPYIKYTTIVIAAAAFIIFWYLVNRDITDDSIWSELQPIITFIPILSFTVLRNAHPVLRNFYSAAFAWLGRYSGEMYVMQDHLWLAGDQEAVLRTGLFHGNDTVNGDRWRDLLILTPLYLITCCIIGDATGTISAWFTTEAKAPEKKVAAAPRNRTTDEVEMGLLAGDAGVMDEDYVSEKTAPRPPIWQRVGEAVWPSRVRDRALLLLGAMWFLNLTYR